MTTKPLEGKIIVNPDAEEQKSSVQGSVMAVGRGKTLEDGSVSEMEIKPGDKVLFSKYAGTKITIDGEEHLILREDEVLGVVETSTDA